MENETIDYKKLYEQELQAHQESLLTISEKESAIADLQHELEKFRGYIFGTKSEKRTANVGLNQMGLFELGTTQAVQEELSESVPTTEQKPLQRKSQGHLSYEPSRRAQKGRSGDRAKRIH